jgi:hypothetical protein
MPERAPLTLSDLRVPDQAKMASVVAALSEKGRADFLRELYEALAESAATNDHAPVQFVVNAWWVSRTFAMHPRWEAAYEAAGKSLETDHGYDAAELSEFFAPA